MIAPSIFEEYPTYEQIEKLKQQAWEKIEETSNPREKVFYLLNGVVKSHYWRARMALEDRKDYAKSMKKIDPKNYGPGHRLDIDLYTRHWLYSFWNRDFITDEMQEILENDWYYKPVKNKYLPIGCTSYVMETSPL